MSDRDPCAGCRSLRTYTCPLMSPRCARQANYGDPKCRPERVPQGQPPKRSAADG